MTEQVSTNDSSIDGAASALNDLLAEHPYYCSESNYYSNDANAEWETMTDFLAEFDSADVDMNLVFRWDIRQRDKGNPDRYYAEVFMMHQRKGIFSPHHIKHINEDEAARFRSFLEKHWAVIRAMWAPVSARTTSYALAIDLIEDGEDAALAAPPVRAIDAELPARIARGGGTVWEAQQVAGLMAWLQRYERALRHIAVRGTGEAAMLAARVLVGDWPGEDSTVAA